MKRLIPLAAVALALGACSTPPPTGGPARPGPNIVTNVHPYKAGSGVVQAVLPVPGTSGTAGSAAAGTAAAAGSSGDMQRLEIKMQDGSIQYVDVASRDFPKGTRVTLTPDRYIKKS